MTTEIERRIASQHPESLEALSKEVSAVFAPVINAMNVGLALQQKMYADPDQFVNRLESTLSKLVDRMDNELRQVTTQLSQIHQRMMKMEQEQTLIKGSMKALVELVEGENHGKSS